MKDYAKGFYKGKAWQQCRDAYAKSVGYLCENCLKRGLYVPGKVVHHKTHISPDNINDSTVTLNWDNLILVCMDCHAMEHKKKDGRRYLVDSEGRIIVDEEDDLL